jgi:hypothetical protein
MDPAQSYPLLQGQGVLNLSRPVEQEKKDEVKRAGWKTDEDPLGGRPARKIRVDKPRADSRDGYIVGDGESVEAPSKSTASRLTGNYRQVYS